jgi:ATP adenylyltransferase
MAKPLWAPWRLEYIEAADEPGRCIFCEPDEHLVVHRGRGAFVLMNRFPYTSGHVMVAPYRHEGRFGGLTDAEALELHQLAARAVAVLEEEYTAQGHNLGWNLGRAAGAGITDHLHLHVVPRWVGDTNFMPVLGGVRVVPEALEASAERLRARWQESP